MTSAKVAVSIPTDTLKAVERLRKRLQMSRSAAVSEALRAWLLASDLDGPDRRYAEAYLHTPERVDETNAIAVAVTSVWESWT